MLCDRDFRNSLIVKSERTVPSWDKGNRQRKGWTLTPTTTHTRTRTHPSFLHFTQCNERVSKTNIHQLPPKGALLSSLCECATPQPLELFKGCFLTFPTQSRILTRTRTLNRTGRTICLCVTTEECLKKASVRLRVVGFRLYMIFREGRLD